MEVDLSGSLELRSAVRGEVVSPIRLIGSEWNVPMTKAAVLVCLLGLHHFCTFIW